MSSAALVERLVYSFVVGALSVSALSITAEKFGSKLAGALGGFPARVAASLYFMASATDVRHAVEATTVIPISMGIFGLFLVSYIALVERGVGSAVLASFGLWIFLSSAVMLIGFPEYLWGFVIFLLLLGACWYTVEYALAIPATAGQHGFCLASPGG